MSADLTFSSSSHVSPQGTGYRIPQYMLAAIFTLKSLYRIVVATVLQHNTCLYTSLKQYTEESAQPFIAAEMEQIYHCGYDLGGPRPLDNHNPEFKELLSNFVNSKLLLYPYWLGGSRCTRMLKDSSLYLYKQFSPPVHTLVRAASRPS